VVVDSKSRINQLESSCLVFSMSLAVASTPYLVCTRQLIGRHGCKPHVSDVRMREEVSGLPSPDRAASTLVVAAWGETSMHYAPRRTCCKTCYRTAARRNVLPVRAILGRRLGFGIGHSNVR
jgi:hypothetical protein